MTNTIEFTETEKRLLASYFMTLVQRPIGFCNTYVPLNIAEYCCLLG